MDGYLRHLANFARVVDAGSVTGAANQRGVSPSSMSESIRILEAHFAMPLLERRRSGVVPTGKGVTVHAEAREIVAALDRAMGRTQPGRETVKVSLPQEAAVFNWFTPAIAHLRENEPLIDVVLLPEDRLEDHSRYARDIFIRVGRKPSALGLTWLAEGAETAVLAGTPGAVGAIDPASPAEVATLPFLRAPSAQRSYTMTLAGDAEVTFADIIQAEGVNTRIAMARAGVGIVACLKRSILDDIESGRMIHLLPDHFALPVDVVVGSPHAKPSQAVRTVAAAFEECL